MNPYAIGAAIGLLAGLAYGYRAWRSAARRLAAIQEEFKTPAPAAIPPPAPASPGEGVPEPVHDCGPVTKHVAKRAGGCLWAWHRASGEWEHVHHCGRSDFDVAEWEAKLQP